MNLDQRGIPSLIWAATTPDQYDCECVQDEALRPASASNRTDDARNKVLPSATIERPEEPEHAPKAALEYLEE